MNSRLFARSTGELSPRAWASNVTSDLLRSFGPAPHHRFDGRSSSGQEPQGQPASIWAHRVGVNALALEKFDGRILVSGGADGSIKLWNLDDASTSNEAFTFKPIGVGQRSVDPANVNGHSHGVTHLDFYPFDPDAFLSSAFDKTLKLWSTNQATVSASFSLNANIYSHATSPIADHLLVACASQHSSVRLVDLKSGSAVQQLVAHGGAVLSVAWSPRHEHILTSGHVDGKVRIWDIRRAGGVFTCLDQEDSLGITHRFQHATAAGLDWSTMPRYRLSARAHNEGVNGLTWTSDGKYIISAGLDRRIHVWDACTGANTLVSFGSVVQNRIPNSVNMLVSPVALTPSHKEILVWPNEGEILILNLHDGQVISRLRVPGATNSQGLLAGAGFAVRNRITALAWRGAGGDSTTLGPEMGGATSAGGIYSAHLDGQIRVWMPRLVGAETEDSEDTLNEDENAKRRKRKVIDDAYKSLMGQKVTFA